MDSTILLCNDGKPHNWKVVQSWNEDYHRCFKCGKGKRVDEELTVEGEMASRKQYEEVLAFARNQLVDLTANNQLITGDGIRVHNGDVTERGYIALSPKDKLDIAKLVVEMIRELK